jgi:hypothetical protein
MDPRPVETIEEWREVVGVHHAMALAPMKSEITRMTLSASCRADVSAEAAWGTPIFRASCGGPRR